jgi:capsule polysaccharide modification protein KpsS
LISTSLPNGVYLYVKEHPSYWFRDWHEGMGESRNRKYYDDIVALRNVKLIRHDYNSLEIVDHCSALVTITGTAGFEALFRGKPVMLFGEQVYSEFPGVFRVRTTEDCELAVKQIINGNVHIADRDLRIALKAIEPYVVSRSFFGTADIDKNSEFANEKDNSTVFSLVDAVLRCAKDCYGVQIKE